MCPGLDYLAVHPSQMRKGIATALVQSGINMAKELGIDVYVLAFSMGREVYDRLGFKEVERNIQDLATWGGSGEYAVYFMILEVNKA
jgi:N-acetylglutamate synthase-like GNAT family acetyltransferase